MSSLNYQPIIVIGAGRSGTNILRDTLTAATSFLTWPCDEINYIWRHGNVRYPTDELEPIHARPNVRAYIRNEFDKIAKEPKTEYVVEKTCANSLRISFVDAVLPESKYVFIVRDGRDVVTSALQRWTASIDVGYILRKARFIPVTDIPYYGIRYLANRIYRLTSDEKRLASWGPRFRGMQAMLQTRSLVAVCAQQWQACVEKSERDFQGIATDRVHRLRYEEFVMNPSEEMSKLFSFLGYDPTNDEIARITQNIKASSVGNWRTYLSSQEVEEVHAICNDTLKRYGYL